MNKKEITIIQRCVLKALIGTNKEKGLSRTEICSRMFGHPTSRRTTVFDNLKKLQVKGLVDFDRKSRMIGHRGRRTTYWYITEKGKEFQ